LSVVAPSISPVIVTLPLSPIENIEFALLTVSVKGSLFTCKLKYDVCILFLSKNKFIAEPPAIATPFVLSDARP